MKNHIENIVSSVVSYCTVVLGYSADFIMDIDWMSVGAGILLIARLLHDVPKTIKYLKGGKNDSS